MIFRESRSFGARMSESFLFSPKYLVSCWFSSFFVFSSVCVSFCVSGYGDG